MSETQQPKLTVNTGPFNDVVILGHVSVEDYDREAGRVGACLEDADTNVLYRDTLPTLHEKTIKEIITMSGVPRSVNDKQTAKNQERENAAAAKAGRAPKTVKTVEESPVSYFTKVKASVDPEVWTQIDGYFRKVALETPVDSSPAARQGAPSKANTAKAEEILTREVDDIEVAVEKLLAKVPEFNLERETDGKPNVTSLARLVGSFYNVQLEEAKKSL